MFSKSPFGPFYHIIYMKPYTFWSSLGSLDKSPTTRLQNPPTTTQGFLIKGGKLDMLSKLHFGRLYQTYETLPFLDFFGHSYRFQPPKPAHHSGLSHQRGKAAKVAFWAVISHTYIYMKPYPFWLYLGRPSVFKPPKPAHHHWLSHQRGKALKVAFWAVLSHMVLASKTRPPPLARAFLLEGKSWIHALKVAICVVISHI